MGTCTYLKHIRSKTVLSKYLVVILPRSPSEICRPSAGPALITLVGKFTFTSVSARLCLDNYGFNYAYSDFTGVVIMFLFPKLSQIIRMVSRYTFIFALIFSLPSNFAEELTDRCARFEGNLGSGYPLVECPQAKFMVKDDLFECYDKFYRDIGKCKQTNRAHWIMNPGGLFSEHSGPRGVRRWQKSSQPHSNGIFCERVHETISGLIGTWTYNCKASYQVLVL